MAVISIPFACVCVRVYVHLFINLANYVSVIKIGKFLSSLKHPWLVQIFGPFPVLLSKVILSIASCVRLHVALYFLLI